jgi:acyl-CoA reductase-like NAD-dependent aldehyde dehydrogenase
VKLVSDAVSKGAQVLAGSDSPNDIPGAGFVPTILGSVNQSSELNHEEAFGPLASLRTFETDMEAIRIANAAPYGLSAAVFTRDLRRGLAIAKKLESGAVHINSMTVHDEPALPFGGVKNSGWGRFNSDQGLNEFLVTKSVTWDDYDDSKMLE